MSVDLSTYGGLTKDPGYAGDLVDQSLSDVVSAQNTGATAITPGRAVAADAGGIGAGTGATCKAVAADGDAILGIALRYPVRPADFSTLAVTYKQYDEIPIIKKGQVYALASEGVTRGDAVLSLTAGGGTLGGTTGGAAGTGRVAVPGAIWETTTASGKLGIIRINS